MTIALKLAAIVVLSTLGLSAQGAYARTPLNVGDQQTQCAADGGEFSVGDSANTYDCDTDEGSWTCDFSAGPADCDTSFAEAGGDHAGTLTQSDGDDGGSDDNGGSDGNDD